MSKSRPKSHKADGTPKRRWSAQERAERGRRPRKRGGAPRRGEDERTPKHQRKQRSRARAEAEPRRERGEHPRSKPQRGVRRTHAAGHSSQKQHHRPPQHCAPETDHMSWEATDVELPQQWQGDSGFLDLGVDPRLVSLLAAKGITTPFEIQQATIADALSGRDVLGRGRTGSGKTLAFGLPLLTRLADAGARGGPRAMILSPTRELAMQIADDLAPLASAVGLKLTLVAGGMSYGPQIKAFQRGVDVVVATPGRLIDLLEQGAADLSTVSISVLDEADQMSDMGFLPDVKRLLDATRPHGQYLLFSATLDDAVRQVVERYLSDPVTHEVDGNRASVTTMSHHLLHTPPHHKNAVTAEVANRDGKTVVFARTQRGADRIASQLRQAGVLAGALHGGLTQGARARIMAAFKRDELPVLVATDVAARGIHVDDVSLVLQVDPPMGPKDYLHRAGRTARAGEAGAVVSIVLPHQRKQFRRLTGQAGVNGTAIEAAPGDEQLREITGARPVSGEPISETDYHALIAPRQGRPDARRHYPSRRRSQGGAKR